jgi:UDP-glucose 4-epimerase
MRWIVCGDGFLGKDFESLTNSINIPKEVHRTLKYAHLSSEADLDASVSWLNKSQPSIFLNAAGPSNVSDSLVNWEYYESEPKKLVEAHIRLISALKNPPTYVYISSAAVYGETPLSGATEITPPNPISPYGLGKLNAEEYLQALTGIDLPIVILRIFSSYSRNLESRLPHAIREKFSISSHAEFAGTGQELRDFVHTRDIFDASTHILGSELQAGSSTWNVASGVPVSVRDVVQLAIDQYKRLGKELSYSFSFNGEVRAYDPRILLADISKLRGLGFEPFLPPKVGLTDYFSIDADDN